MSKAVLLIVELRSRGVDLSADAHGGISFRAPQGAITQELRGALAINKPAVVELLQAEAEYEGLQQRILELAAEADACEFKSDVARRDQLQAEQSALVVGPYAAAGDRFLELVGDRWQTYPARGEVAVQPELVGVR